MKVKSISDTGSRVAAPKTYSGSTPKPAASAILAIFVLLLTVAAALCPPALAQQTDLPSATNPNAQPQANTPAAPDPSSDDSTEAMFPHFKDTRFWLSGQANFIFQTHPPFHADYSGTNSLSPDYQKATSRVLTLYTGMRLNNSTELLVDIEEAGGSALSLGLGLAGNTDLDIVRNPLLSKAPYLSRAMIHKVFALSKDKVENQRSYLSLFEELPRRRLEIRFGKFSMPDFFDINSVSSDTHLQFINWTTDNNGAYDYAADTRGYTIGATADFEDHNWGFRFAEALMPKVANGIDLVYRPWQVHAENFEYELRHGVIPRKAGVVRLLAYTNYANMGIYRDAVQQFEDHTAPTPESIPEITNHPWHITRKYGFGFNFEQNLLPNLTAFARVGWDNGKTESFAYTEVDQTVSWGLGANGAWWHRKQDRAGIALVSNAIKKDHQNYLDDGGLGFLLGDGALNYGRENIVESYYTVHAWRGIYLAPGLQHIVNPGYNRDRGPVLVPSFRAHVEF
ncbi:MAG: carbohydrate porin [Candidatus Sulfotelmatobacter sp.]